MARPRVILACKDTEAAVKMIGSLNPKRYRVEHLRDLNEALLRAELVLAHALVIHDSSTAETPQALIKRCQGTADRVTPVFVSRSSEMQVPAATLKGRFLAEPFEVPDFKRAVYRAVSKTEDRRQRKRPLLRDVRRRSMRRVLLLTSQAVTGAVMAAVLRNQLSVTCEVATSAREALTILEDPVDCVVAEVHLLLASEPGAAVARNLTRRGIPVIPLKETAELDPSAAGQAAWDVVPQVRRSLTARDKPTREAG